MKTLLPTKSRSAIRKELKKRKYENLELVETIEKYLKKKRGYVFKMPKKGSPVILLLSGGLDSVSAWKILLREYEYTVYPIFFHRGTKRYRQELASVNYFYGLFRREEGLRCRKPFEISTTIPPKEFERYSKPENLHPVHILDALDPGRNVSRFFNIGVLPYVFPFFAAAYARNLYYSENIFIPHIFSAVGAGDGLVVPSQTFTALRSTMLDMCVATAQYYWEFTSLLIEPEIGHYIEKGELLSAAAKLGVPLEKTWSCYKPGRIHCGECQACLYRRLAFKRARLKDKTVYGGRLSFLQKAKRLLTNVRNRKYD